MKQAKVVITISENTNGRVALDCHCDKGDSKKLNKLAHEIANQLPPHVLNAIHNVMKTNSIH